MLTLCIVSAVLAFISFAASIYLYVTQGRHYECWDRVTDRIIEQTNDVVNNHNNRLNHLELSLGGIYTPFGYHKAEKA